MLKVLVEPAQSSLDAVTVRNGETNGYKWVMRSQHCWIFQPASKFPELFVITLPDNVPFYPAGDYLLNVEAMIVPNPYKSLSLGRGGVVLNPFIEDDADTKKADFSKKFGA